MIRKLLLSGAIVCALLPTGAAAPTARIAVSYPQVRKVQCFEGSGTAFLTERGWVSVNHVTSLHGCRVEGGAVHATQEGDLDLSRFHVPVDVHAAPLKINCDGFKTGSYVWAIGYAGGFEWQSMSRHYATYKFHPNAMRILLGEPTVIPGMSGGPILNEQGEVVGTVNMFSRLYPLSFSQELKGTSLCKDHAHA